MKWIRVFVLTFLFSGVYLGIAQDCARYFPMKKGALMEMTNYDKKGKVLGKTISKVLDVQDLPAGKEIVIESNMVDDKENELYGGEYKFKCENGKFYVDFQTKLGSAEMMRLANMEMDFEGDMIEFPSTLSVGQNLPDASMTMKMATSGVNLLSMSADISNRKVEAKENITTPAGTFDCFKISYDIEVRFGLKSNSSVTEWYADGVGVVKSESYDKKGKLSGYTELTRFEK